jgi:hypothetical protein
MTLQEAEYIVRHYWRFLTLAEKAAAKRLHVTMKATQGRSDAPAQQEAQHHKVLPRWLLPDDEVQQMTRDGYESFAERVAERILAENKVSVFLNYCPRCHKLARTPKAQQCRFCGNDWHST